MDSGNAFLKSQVNNAAIQHRTFLSTLEAHEDQAEDSRFMNLCARHIPHMREHQRMLDEYRVQLGVEPGVSTKLFGAAVDVVRDLADAARESDYIRLVGDIVMARQSEHTFKTFREAGRMMGNRTLQEIGEIGERHHDAYAKEANRLVQHMFVEQVEGVDGVAQPPAFRVDATI
ncbi:MAG: hypothetical protein NVS1B5_20720 [Gemmatimonadaceae bacterium]